MDDQTILSLFPRGSDSCCRGCGRVSVAPWCHRQTHKPGRNGGRDVSKPPTGHLCVRRDRVHEIRRNHLLRSVRLNSTLEECRSWIISQRWPRHENIDFIECRRVDSAGFLMVRVWRVAIILDGNKTGEVLVSHYVDGP